MFYELTHLALKLYTVPRALPALEDYATNAAARGRLLGCWETEHGEIVGRVLLLREFEDAGALAEERRRILASANPFGVGEHLDSFTVSSYA
ncbi:MAG TPA: NIPSNAP family protein, partial [Streptomyces sp.]